MTEEDILACFEAFCANKGKRCTWVAKRALQEYLRGEREGLSQWALQQFREFLEEYGIAVARLTP